MLPDTGSAAGSLVVVGIALIALGVVLVRFGRLKRGGVLALSLAMACVVLGMPGWQSPAQAEDCTPSSAPVAPSPASPTEILADTGPQATAESTPPASTPTPTSAPTPTSSATSTPTSTPTPTSSATPTPTPTVLPAVVCPEGGNLDLLLPGESMVWTPVVVPGRDLSTEVGAATYEYVYLYQDEIVQYVWHVVRASDGAVSPTCEGPPRQAGACVPYDLPIYRVVYYWIAEADYYDGFVPAENDYEHPGYGTWVFVNSLATTGCGGGGDN